MVNGTTRTDPGSRPTRGDPPRRSRGATSGLDQTDLALLRMLALDARWSQRRLAQAIGFSAPAIAERIARLEAAGVIRGYRAEVDKGLIGFPLLAYLGAVTVQGADQARLVEALRDLPEVEDVQIVTGPMDLLVRVRVRDTAHLRQLLFDQIWCIEGIQRTETFVSLGGMEPKNVDVSLLDALLPPGADDSSGPG